MNKGIAVKRKENKKVSSIRMRPKDKTSLIELFDSVQCSIDDFIDCVKNEVHKNEYGKYDSALTTFKEMQGRIKLKIKLSGK